MTRARRGSAAAAAQSPSRQPRSQSPGAEPQHSLNRAIALPPSVLLCPGEPCFGALAEAVPPRHHSSLDTLQEQARVGRSAGPSRRGSVMIRKLVIVVIVLGHCRACRFLVPDRAEKSGRERPAGPQAGPRQRRLHVLGGRLRILPCRRRGQGRRPAEARRGLALVTPFGTFHAPEHLAGQGKRHRRLVDDRLRQRHEVRRRARTDRTSIRPSPTPATST